MCEQHLSNANDGRRAGQGVGFGGPLGELENSLGRCESSGVSQLVYRIGMIDDD